MRISLYRPVLSFVIVLLFLLATACSHTKNLSFTEKGGQIPPGWKQFKDTLLIVSHSEDWGYNKYLRKNFGKYYTGPYKILKTVVDLNRHYPAANYPYILDHHINYSNQMSANGTWSNRPSSDYFFIEDRITGKKYQTASSAYYSKLMRAYVIALEAERGK